MLSELCHRILRILRVSGEYCEQKALWAFFRRTIGQRTLRSGANTADWRANTAIDERILPKKLANTAKRERILPKVDLKGVFVTHFGVFGRQDELMMDYNTTIN